MPRKQVSLGRVTSRNRRGRESRARETEERRCERQTIRRARRAQNLITETTEDRENRLRMDRERRSMNRRSECVEGEVRRLERDSERHRQDRLSETEDARERRLNAAREYSARVRCSEGDLQRQTRLLSNRERMQSSRRIPQMRLKLAARNYDPSYDYAVHPYVVIGPMNRCCRFCDALNFKNEAPGLCCSNGKVKLPELRVPPEPLFSLVSGATPTSRKFLDNICRYNSCFQMTSFGATRVVREPNYMPTFKVQGQIYHRVGSLLPVEGEEHKFLQIYFMGSVEEEVNQRLRFNVETDRYVVRELQDFLHEHNILVRTFKTALQHMPVADYVVRIRADKTPNGEHERRFNAPTSSEVAVVIVGEEFHRRDIILHRQSGDLSRVAETHRSYDALQYPLLFWQGEDGYHFNIKMQNPRTGVEDSKKVSCMNYYAYRLMVRNREDSHILKCRRLFQQYVVDMYAKIETERLLYIRLNQVKLRSEEYIHLRDAVAVDNHVRPEDIGKVVILPSSFVGSPRHMHEYTQDAMTYVRNYGRPDFFITFTCNPSWDEIRALLIPGQVPSDRPDIVARVFKQKLKSFMDLIVKHQVFGEVRCWMYSIEWQKRGLPHSHLLIWLYSKITPDIIDDIISAEIPDKEVDPELFTVVTKNMIHGPCGALNINCTCMKDGKCSKRFPWTLIPETITSTDGFPLYRRRAPNDGGQTFKLRTRNGILDIDNRWVVPYCPLLSKTFKAHINVEYCHSVKSIKYICKYVNKGSDMAIFGLGSNSTIIDEVEQYQLGRYISSSEATWRIFSFAIHERHPTVYHLAVHLENGQRVSFTAENIRERAGSPPPTTLTGFFTLCETDVFARSLLYSEIPKYYTWNKSTKKFQRRKQGKTVTGHPEIYSSDALGRVYTVHPGDQECFYLRLLLVNVRGPRSFDELRTVNGELCTSYREACQKLNLLENDSQWTAALTDASERSNSHPIRMLFAIILTTCSPSDPQDLWEKFKDHLTEDILYRFRRSNNDSNLQYTSAMYNETLILIEDVCLTICNRNLNQLGLPTPDRTEAVLPDRDLNRETQYNIDNLKNYVKTNQPKLTPDQRAIYETVMEAITTKTGGLYFLDAPGGTGKTFLISLILAVIRSQGRIALAMASSGIAATLLEGGRTAHSALKLPLNLQMCEKPMCNIKKRSGMASVLCSSEIIIWDECTMAHKKALEAFDRTMQDLMNDSRAFGGNLVLLSGDFRQTLPVVPRGTPADEINACLKSSNLWREVRQMTLSTNMRVQLQDDVNAIQFADQLLRLGNGKIPTDEITQCIDLPSTLCVVVSSEESLIQKVFPDIIQNYKDHQWLSERVILIPKNVDVNLMNNEIQDRLPGEVHTYKSIDTVLTENEAVSYPTEFLNSLDLPGLPPHELSLKVGTPVICLRNINPPRLCNGTRLAIKTLMNNLIETTILNGKYKGENILIPRIPMIPTDLPFEFKRLQFPVRLAFAMTINKAQGQSLRVCGVSLENPCFSHGQLYVACSRVGKPTDLYIYAPTGRTKNIVYPKVLD